MRIKAPFFRGFFVVCALTLMQSKPLQATPSLSERDRYGTACICGEEETAVPSVVPSGCAYTLKNKGSEITLLGCKEFQSSSTRGPIYRKFCSRENKCELTPPAAKDLGGENCRYATSTDGKTGSLFNCDGCSDLSSPEKTVTHRVEVFFGPRYSGKSASRLCELDTSLVGCLEELDKAAPCPINKPPSNAHICCSPSPREQVTSVPQF